MWALEPVCYTTFLVLVIFVLWGHEKGFDSVVSFEVYLDAQAVAGLLEPTQKDLRTGSRRPAKPASQEFNFNSMTEQIQAGYLDKYKIVQAQIYQVCHFDDLVFVRTKHLSLIEMSRRDALRAQEEFSITDQSTTMGTFLHGTDCKILLDSDAAKSFISG